jgi:hypothetical protein
MKYTLDSGKVVNIPDKEIEKNMKLLEISQEEAVEMWLEDEGYLDNEEQIELDTKAKQVKIDHGASAVDKTQKKEKKWLNLVRLLNRLLQQLPWKPMRLKNGKVWIPKK